MRIECIKFHQSSYFAKLHILLLYKLNVFTSDLVKSNIIKWGIFTAKDRNEENAILNNSIMESYPKAIMKIHNEKYNEI